MRKKQAEIPRSQVQIIRKANELVEARYRFDIWEMRVFAKMLMSIEHEDKDFSKYNIHINELLNAIATKNAMVMAALRAHLLVCFQIFGVGEHIAALALSP